MSLVIDVQHHYVPRAIAQRNGFIPGEVKHLVRDNQRWMTLHDRVCDLDWQLSEMDEAGIDIAVLSSFFGWDGTEEDCQTINNDLARIRKAYDGRFQGFAHIPLHDMKRALFELDRAIGDLGLSGVTIMSQVNNRPLDDPRLEPFYRRVSELDIPIYVHPVMFAGGHQWADDYDLGRIIGREFDLQTATVRLIAGGILERYPNLKIIMSHFGGGVAAVFDRISKKAFRFKSGLTKEFAAYFDQLYFETGGFEISAKALHCALTAIRPERLVFGTDYPQDFSAMTTSTGVTASGINEYIQIIRQATGSKADGVLGGHLARLLKLER